MITKTKLRSKHYNVHVHVNWFVDISLRIIILIFLQLPSDVSIADNELICRKLIFIHWTSQLYKEQKWLAFWENSVLTITCNEIMSSIPNVKSSYTLHKKNKFQFFQRQHTCTFPILMTGFKMGFVSLISLKWSTLIHSQLGLVRVPKNYSYQPPPPPHSHSWFVKLPPGEALGGCSFQRFLFPPSIVNRRKPCTGKA